MEIAYAVQQGDGQPNWPKDGLCPICGKNIRGSGQVAYISGGAYWDVSELSVEDHVIPAFLNVGIHGARSDVKDSGNVDIISDLVGGQFDLAFCSTSCLRSWFNSVVDRVEQDLLRNLSGAESPD